MTHAAAQKPTEQLITARWRSELLARYDTWQGRPQQMPGSGSRSPARLLRACMGLADAARPDGSLKASGREGTYWSAKQLAKFMAMSKPTALDTLAWLEQCGLMTKTKGLPTKYGLGVDERHLVRASVKESSSVVDQRSDQPRSKNQGASVKKPGVLGKRVEFIALPHLDALGSLTSSPYKENGYMTKEGNDVGVRTKADENRSASLENVVGQPTPAPSVSSKANFPKPRSPFPVLVSDPEQSRQSVVSVVAAGGVRRAPDFARGDRVSVVGASDELGTVRRVDLKTRETWVELDQWPRGKYMRFPVERLTLMERPGSDEVPGVAKGTP
jgi:hypothetical protein